MSRKSRKKRTKNKELVTSQSLAVKNTVQCVRPLVISPKEDSGYELPITYTDRYRYVLSDLRRAFIIAGTMFLVLIILHLFVL